jgi:hypothetical protein
MYINATICIDYFTLDHLISWKMRRLKLVHGLTGERISSVIANLELHNLKELK